MEKIDIFCEDVVEEILSRLPVRYLLQLRCVSRSWRALIGSYSFMKRHHRVQYSMLRERGDIPLFLDNPLDFRSLFLGDDFPEFYLLSKKGQQDNDLCLTSDLCRDISPYFTNKWDEFDTARCIGVVNGVVGLWWDVELGLWNPATREFKVIPDPSWPFFVNEYTGGIVGLGFDPKSDDFKIVRSLFKNVVKETGEKESIYRYELYSLSTNSWKSLEEPLPNLEVDFSHMDGYFNGVYYWTAFKSERGTRLGCRYLILSFDFDKEVFKLLDAPTAPVMTGEDKWEWMVGQYMEQLALIFSSQNTEKRVYNIEIWVVGRTNDEDNGTPLSWKHLLTVGQIPAFDGVCLKAFRMDGDLMLKISIERKEDFEAHFIGCNEYFEGPDNYCCLYNPSTRTFSKLRVSIHSCYRYVESLFSLTKKGEKMLAQE